MQIAIDRDLQDRTSKDYIINTMTNGGRYSVRRGMLAEKSVLSRWPKSETRVDIALLVSALFLQRFSLPFGQTYLMLEFLPAAVILPHQFLSGKLVLQYDRLLWFLVAMTAVSYSLLLNFSSTMLASYSLFVVLYSFMTLRRPCTAGQYKNTLQAFQFLVLILSCIGVVQFFAQFVINGRQLIMFYGIVPDFLFGFFYAGGENTIHPLYQGSAILKSNGLFLGEPSNFSQITALGILIEVLEFRRPRYLLIMALGFLVAYSGTGLITLLLFLPLAGLRHSRAGLSVLLVVMFALGLLATGVVEMSVFSSRVGEFQDPQASAFVRFVGPLKLTAQQFDTAPLRSLLVGNGPGTAKNFIVTRLYSGGEANWFKLFVEYGIIGSFIFACFLASCLRNSRCPGLVLWALVFSYVAYGGLVDPKWVIILVVLCTLSGPKARQDPMYDMSGYRPFVAPSP
jgi:hypothetical protein